MTIIYSACCGKFITKEKVFKSKNILQTSKLKEVGNFVCSGCRQKTTSKGTLPRVKKVSIHMKTFQITLKDGQTKTLQQETQPFIELLAELGQKQVTEEQFYEMLGALPPQAMHGTAFLVGEPSTHSYCPFSAEIVEKFECYFSHNDLFYSGGLQSEKSFDVQFVQNFW